MVLDKLIINTYHQPKRPEINIDRNYSWSTKQDTQFEQYYIMSRSSYNADARYKKNKYAVNASINLLIYSLCPSQPPPFPIWVACWMRGLARLQTFFSSVPHEPSLLFAWLPVWLGGLLQFQNVLPGKLARRRCALWNAYELMTKCSID
jgi:hypothetical protein